MEILRVSDEESEFWRGLLVRRLRSQFRVERSFFMVMVW